MKQSNYGKMLIAAMMTFAISACGGGGGDSSGGDNGGGVTPPPPVQPTNTAPTISGLSSTYKMDENTVMNLTYSVSDAEGDVVTVTSKSSNAAVTVAQQGNTTVLLTAGEVSQDLSSTITLTASDGKLSSSKTFVVTVSNKVVTTPPDPEPDPEPTKAPVVSWSTSYGSSPMFAVNEKTMEDFIFTLTDEDSDLSKVNVSSEVAVLAYQNETEKQNIENGFSIVVDKVNGLVKTVIPNVSGYTSVAIVLTATDEKGNSSKSKELVLNFTQRDQVSYVDDYSNKYPAVGSSSVVNVSLVTSSETAQTKIESIEYENPQYAATNAMGISTINGTSFTITPTESVAGNIVVLKLRVFLGEENGVSSYFENTIKFKPQFSGSIEETWASEINEMNEMVKNAFEYQKIAKYFNDELYFSGKIDSAEYLSNAKKIKFADYENIYKSAQYTNARYENAMDKFMQQEDGMVAEIDNFIKYQKSIFEAGVNSPYQSVALVNSLANKMYPSTYNFAEESLVLIGDNQYSRFIDNANYGSYVNGKWVFTGVYDFMNSVLM